MGPVRCSLAACFIESNARLLICHLNRFWTKRSFVLFASIFLPLSVKAELPDWQGLPLSLASEPMPIRIVRSGRAGCEPKCAEWISFEGTIDERSTHQFGIAANSLRGKKVPVLIDSPGGDIYYAMAMGTLIRARGLDVVVARTEFEPCANSSNGCKEGGEKGTLGRLSSQPARCSSACTFVLAGGLHRIMAPGAQIGVHSISLDQTKVEKWRKIYRGKISFEDLMQQRVSEPRSLMLRYFEKMGIAREIVGLMESVPSSEILFISESELMKLGLITDKQAGQSLIELLAK